MNNKATEQRHLARTIQVRMSNRETGTEFPTLIGYASVFFNADDPGTQYQLYQDFYERVMPTAFDRAIREADDVRALYNHDPNMVLGRCSAGTLRLSVDTTGLRYEIDPPDTEMGRSVVEAIRRGDITGSSFSFDPESLTYREEYSADGMQQCTIREVNSVRLFDVGPVTFPAYESSSADVRSTELFQKWQRSKTAPLPAVLARYRARAVQVDF